MSDADYHFEYFLARELRMSRAQLIRTITQEEYLGWTRFYALERQHQEMEQKKMEAKARRRRR